MHVLNVSFKQNSEGIVTSTQHQHTLLPGFQSPVLAHPLQNFKAIPAHAQTGCKWLWSNNQDLPTEASLPDQGQKRATAGMWCALYQGNVSAVEHHISIHCNIPKPGAAALTFKALTCLYPADGTQEKCQKSLDSLGRSQKRRWEWPRGQ